MGQVHPLEGLKESLVKECRLLHKRIIELEVVVACQKVQLIEAEIKNAEIVKEARVKMVCLTCTNKGLYSQCELGSVCDYWRPY